MNFEQKNPPREYQCGNGPTVTIRDCGTLQLQPDEQVTFGTESGGEYDLTRKSWGFYATPSINGRLQRFGFETVLVKNRGEKFFVLLVERGHQEKFQQYVEDEGLIVVAKLDDELLTRFESVTRENSGA